LGIGDWGLVPNPQSPILALRFSVIISRLKIN
jgi:hypothetical protein